ncbi:MAG TPA: hydroxymethylglutaryl-CoA reductase [Candidatus Eisenbacteria bacterium]|nr:hydroxymethylglutaryl-CoA reductase [Candidatus Eisenbacteria bacterium]
MATIPRSREDDYTTAQAEARRAFIREVTGAELRHVGSHTLDPATLPGNIEHFIGAAQVPIGVAGPLLVHGEHAMGEFYVPMATTEGTLVASYNRGMKLLHRCGGVKTTVSDDAMQRAPVFVFDSAREARDFGPWIEANMDEIRRRAEATTRSGRLRDIERYTANHFMFLRFNFTTRDAAGQNMVGKATEAACEWIRGANPQVRCYYLESAFATDKKTSRLNLLHTRGKRVTAEAIVPAQILHDLMRVEARDLFRARLVNNVGGFLSGVENNGNHSANAIAALFIATGQDAANVAESSAAVVYADLTEDGAYRYSITIPSLVVATHGGGTGLGTQRECLEMLGCYGAGKVRKLAEIVAATVLCGELSLGSAVVSGEWVDAHDRYGRNR